jgi:esterase/lipase
VNKDRKENLTNRMVIASHLVKSLLSQIKEIETNEKTSANEKLSQIKKIREEIAKVGTEIDSVKNEINLLTTYNVN